MYALPNKKQHKLIAKVRGGISQKLDNFNSATANSGISATAAAAVASSFSSKEATATASTLATSSTSSKTNLSNPSSSPLSSFARHIDETGFNADLNCLPQPVFQHSNKSNKFYSNKTSKQCITPEHNEMIKYVQQSWKGVERDYKKSVNSYITNLNGSLSSSAATPSLSTANNHEGQHQAGVKARKKTATTSSPLLLTGSYHHHATTPKDSTGNNRQDTFRPFDLEAFWGNRILKRLTQDTL